MSTRRVAYIHAGTHKTGTTSIQTLLAANDDAFLRAGIFVPQTGRLAPGLAGHHNVAWELGNPYRFNPAGGTLAALLDEVSRAGLPRVCISSEEFEFLAGDPARLARLHDGFAAIGYEPHAILYLRPQADYLESLYAELIKGGWPIDFEAFRSTVLATGRYAEIAFDYDVLTGTFECVFGRERFHVRAFRGAAPPDSLLAEFVALVTGDASAVDLALLERPGRMNQQLGFDEVLHARALQVAGGAPAAAPAPRSSSPASGSSSFAPLTLLDIAEIALRFWPSNDRVARRYGIALSGASRPMFVREMLGALFADSRARERKRRIRALRQAAA